MQLDTAHANLPRHLRQEVPPVAPALEDRAPRLSAVKHVMKPTRDILTLTPRHAWLTRELLEDPILFGTVESETRRRGPQKLERESLAPED